MSVLVGVGSVIGKDQHKSRCRSVASHLVRHLLLTSGRSAYDGPGTPHKGWCCGKLLCIRLTLRGYGDQQQHQT